MFHRCLKCEDVTSEVPHVNQVSFCLCSRFLLVHWFHLCLVCVTSAEQPISRHLPLVVAVSTSERGGCLGSRVSLCRELGYEVPASVHSFFSPPSLSLSSTAESFFSFNFSCSLVRWPRPSPLPLSLAVVGQHFLFASLGLTP